MQTKIRNLNLEAKQKRLAESRSAYEAEKNRLSGLYGTTDQLRSKADAAQDVVNTKVRSSRIALKRRAHFVYEELSLSQCHLCMLTTPVVS